MQDWYKKPILQSVKPFLVFFLIILISFTVLAKQYTQDYNDPITYSKGDLRWCKLYGVCTFDTLTVYNLSVIGQVFNVTMNLVTWNITESFNVGGNIVAKNATFDNLNVTGTVDINYSLDDAYDDGSVITVDDTDVVWNVTDESLEWKIQNADNTKFFWIDFSSDNYIKMRDPLNPTTIHDWSFQPKTGGFDFYLGTTRIMKLSSTSIITGLGKSFIATDTNANRQLIMHAEPDYTRIYTETIIEVPFYLESPRSIEFTIDSDNDDTGQAFIWSSDGTIGNGTDLMVLNESGTLDIFGGYGLTGTTIYDDGDISTDGYYYGDGSKLDFTNITIETKIDSTLNPNPCFKFKSNGDVGVSLTC